jgi:Flp pilus assembly protein TadD
MAEAEQAFRRVVELAPQRVATHMMLSLVILEQGRIEEALTEAMNEPEEWARLTMLAVVQHEAGRKEEPDQAFTRREVLKRCHLPIAHHPGEIRA